VPAGKDWWQQALPAAVVQRARLATQCAFLLAQLGVHLSARMLELWVAAALPTDQTQMAAYEPTVLTCTMRVTEKRSRPWPAAQAPLAAGRVLPADAGAEAALALPPLPAAASPLLVTVTSRQCAGHKRAFRRPKRRTERPRSLPGLAHGGS